MARRWKTFSEFGAWLDVTLDDVFGAVLVTLLFMFYWNRPEFIVAVFIIGVVLVPTAALAYNGSMAIAGKIPDAAKKIGAGGVRAMNFWEHFVRSTWLVFCFWFAGCIITPPTIIIGR